MDIELRCSCGALRGIATGLSTATGNRAVCYCDDCQAFAHFLGRADEILDAHGGTDVFQTSSANLRFTGGAERLACVRLTSLGPLRWYASCCGTPVGNTLAIRLAPFLGLMRFALRDDGTHTLEEALGPVRWRVEGRYARGAPAGEAVHDRVPVRMILRVARLLLMARLKGDHKRSPFFDARTGKPVAVPQLLDEETLERLYEARRER